MFANSGWGQGCWLLPFLFRRFGAGLEAVAVISSFEDVAAMGEAIEQRRCHLGVTEDSGPFAEAQVGGNDDAGALVKFAEKMEQQRTARGAERQVSQLVEDHQFGFQQGFGDIPCFALCFCLLKRIDQFHGREEAHPLAMMLDGLDT